MSMRLRIVQQGNQQVSGRARIRRPLRLATRLTRGRQLARTLHRYVAPSLETAARSASTSGNSRGTSI